MQITINGELKEINEDILTITRLLEIENVESPEMVSVQVNGAIVERHDYGERRIVDKDEVEFLFFMGGGTF